MRPRIEPSIDPRSGQPAGGQPELFHHTNGNGGGKRREFDAEPDSAAPSTGQNGHAEKTPRKRRAKLADGLRAPSVLGKNFVLDTNVLLHDPGSVQRFGDNHVCVPFEVLCELDRFKSEQSERGANARAVHRELAEIFSAHPELATRGIPTAGGGTVRLVTPRPDDRQSKAAGARILDLLPHLDSADHRLLLCAWLVAMANPAPAILVTKDLNLQLKAHALGIPCDDYLSDKVVPSGAQSHRMRRIELPASDVQRFASTGRLEPGSAPATIESGLALNEYVLLQNGDKRTLPARYAGKGAFERLRIPEFIRVNKGAAIRPLNLGQQCFLDALLNPEISLVTCYGQAGTGKTLLTVAAALHATIADAYAGVTISRPVVPLGETLGFLPGTLDEKLHPWLKPIFDALEFILVPPGAADWVRKPKKGGASRAEPPTGAANGALPRKCYQPYIDSGVIEVEALCYIRGRSIPNRFFILDEAQQLT
ncbi:MAG: PhoH family protein, partial [Verrucomicrobiae bacterium]|nr:PhoH family protein [Verrucomicrobiae bacterium]